MRERVLFFEIIRIASATFSSYLIQVFHMFRSAFDGFLTTLFICHMVIHHNHIVRIMLSLRCSKLGWVHAIIYAFRTA